MVSPPLLPHGELLKMFCFFAAKYVTEKWQQKILNGKGTDPQPFIISVISIVFFFRENIIK